MLTFWRFSENINFHVVAFCATFAKFWAALGIFQCLVTLIGRQERQSIRQVENEGFAAAAAENFFSL